MKKVLSIILAVALFLLCSCGNDKNTSSKKDTKKVTSNTAESVEPSEDSSEQDSEYEDGSSNPSSSSSKNSTAKTSSKRTASAKTLPSGTNSNYYTVYPKVDHPGVVGLDAVYQMVVKSDSGYETEDSLIISVSNSNVKVNGLEITVPYSVRSGYEKVKFTVKNKTNPGLSGTYTFHFKQFSKTPTLYDDFDYDTGLWSTGFYGGTRTGQLINSNMVFSANVGDPSTVLSTQGKFAQSYGCFSSRIKMPEKGSVNAAFWLCTYEPYVKNPSNLNDSGGEIDIVEFWPASKTWAATVHWFGWSDYHKESTQRIKIDFNYTDYNIYSIVWTPSAIYWYINEKLYRAYEGEGVTAGSSAMTVLLQLSPYYKDNEIIGKYNPDDFPVEVWYDWVKVYSLDFQS